MALFPYEKENEFPGNTIPVWNFMKKMMSFQEIWLQSEILYETAS